MTKLPRKLDIHKVMITPKCKLYNITFEGYFPLCYNHIEYKVLIEYVCVYPYISCEYYDILAGRTSTVKTIDRVETTGETTGEYFINPKYNKTLMGAVDIPKYKYDNEKYISYKDLLYIATPIINSLVFSEDKSYFLNNSDDNLYIGSVYQHGNRCNDTILKLYKYFAVDMNSGMPISYVYIHDALPYIKKNELKKYHNKQKTLSK